MARTTDTDLALRARLARWVRYFMKKYAHEYTTQQDFARHIGVSPATINTILSEKRTVGLDTVVKLHRRMHESLDTLVETDPPDSASSTEKRRHRQG